MIWNDRYRYIQRGSSEAPPSLAATSTRSFEIGPSQQREGACDPHTRRLSVASLPRASSSPEASREKPRQSHLETQLVASNSTSNGQNHRGATWYEGPSRGGSLHGSYDQSMHYTMDTLVSYILRTGMTDCSWANSIAARPLVSRLSASSRLPFSSCSILQSLPAQPTTWR